MFQKFRKKKQLEKEQLSNEIQGRLKAELKEIENTIVDRSKAEITHVVQGEYDKLSKRLQKQSSMLEDILETTQESQQEKERLEADIVFRKQKEEQLIYLIMKYQEYLELISDYINGDRRSFSEQESEDMNAQLNLVFGELDNLRSQNGIEIIEKEGGKVDTALHKVIQTQETDKQIMNETVSRVLIPGIIYQGKVIQKAKIIAFIYKKDDGQEE